MSDVSVNGAKQLPGTGESSSCGGVAAVSLSSSTLVSAQVTTLCDNDIEGKDAKVHGDEQDARIITEEDLAVFSCGVAGGEAQAATEASCRKQGEEEASTETSAPRSESAQPNAHRGNAEDQSDSNVTVLVDELAVLGLDEVSTAVKPAKRLQKPRVPRCLQTSGIREASAVGMGAALREGRFRRIVVLAGAGMSVAAGLPDFRSPGTGLYDNLQAYDLPDGDPTAVFDLGFFLENPQPFYTLARDLYPGNYSPTRAHFFIRLLQEKGLLLRHYTQNIDCLERLAGVRDELLVEAHGSFATARCVTCKEPAVPDTVRSCVFESRVPECGVCAGFVKPDIVFFGEDLPEKFYRLCRRDLRRADLVIIIGTSLTVFPFAGLIDYCGSATPRLLINREAVCGYGTRSPLVYDKPQNSRDMFFQGDCDAVVNEIAQEAGWLAELDELHRNAMDSHESEAASE